MKILRLEIENFRKFRQPVVLSGFGDGLNLICDRNEAGKSTVLTALRAALFERHRAGGAHIHEYLPQGRQVAPSVKLEFEAGDQRWTLEKRFLQQPSIRLSADGTVLTSDAAEDKLQSLLGFDASGNRGATEGTTGVLGLLWVEQGVSHQLPVPGDTARRTVHGVLAAEVGAVTGGRRADAVLAAVGRALEELETRTGKPKDKLALANARLAKAQAEVAAARDQLERFRGQLGELERLRTEKALIERDLAKPDLAQERKALEAELHGAKLAAAEVAALAARAGEAAAARRQADAVQRARVELKARLAEQTVAAVTAAHASEARREAFEAAAARESEVRRAVEQARTGRDEDAAALETARGRQNQALRQQAVEAGLRRLADAQALEPEIEALKVQVAAELMDGEALEELSRLETQIASARARLEAGAATLEMAIESEAAGRVVVNGEPVRDGHTLRVIRRTSVVIAGIGQLTYTPPPMAGAAAEAELGRVTASAQAFFKRVGHRDAAAARAAAAARSRAEADLNTKRGRLSTLCPEDPALGISAGLAALTARLVGEVALSPDIKADAEDVPALEAALRESSRVLGECEAAQAVAAKSLSAAEAAFAKAAAEAGSANAQTARLAAELGQGRAIVADDILQEGARQAVVEDGRLAFELDARRQAGAGDPQAIQRRIETQDCWTRNRERDLNDVRERIAGLAATVAVSGGEGPTTRLAEAEETEEAARATAERLAGEARTLRLLKTTIETCAREAAQRYLEPVARRAAPYIRRLFPEADLTFEDDLRLGTLVRAGGEEPTGQLSKGTQEQLAILTRLALADLLLENEKPASLILDDALVFSDDVRFETMLDILGEAASRMQIIILTCRASLFARLDATKVSFSQPV